MKTLENTSCSTSLTRSCTDRPLRRKEGHEGRTPFPGCTHGNHSSSFMMGSTILRAECEASQVIQQLLYFPPTLVNYKLSGQQGFALPDINLLCRWSAEGRNQPLSCLWDKTQLRAAVHRENPISGLQTETALPLCATAVSASSALSDSRARIKKSSACPCCF